MDETKQPGLTIDNVVVTESFFRRKDTVPEQLEYSNHIQTGYKVLTERNQLAVLMSIRSKSTDETVEVGVNYVALISKVPGEENMTFSQYFNSGAPQAMLYTYAREYLQNLTSKGVVPLLILGPLNTKPENPVVIDS